MNPQPVKLCPMCFEVMHSGTRVCGCGHVFFAPRTPANKGRNMRSAGVKRRGTGNGNASLTPEKVRAIRAEHLPYVNTSSLAERYGLHKRTITAISNRETWGWLD